MNPEQRAIVMFRESLGSLMAHTIRAVVNHYCRCGLDVGVRIVADSANAILRSSNPRTTSLLRTRFIKSEVKYEWDRIVAIIFVHKDANKHLARICIAHEIHHLMMEIESFLQNDRKQWTEIPVNAQVESDCDVFARRLCGYHDRFNRDEELRKEQIYFPIDMFSSVVNTHSTEHSLEWPKGVEINPNKPFHKIVTPDWLPAT